ncbi:phosphate-selective porin OprO and OprP [Polaribacter sp. KT25b]|uniref:OprO/OprP family phosphate-selective porin n=1 Tax=Polaribacter sp. KT25b TaxID=1855336 RepID=UPI00087DEC55|nr:porin [Polaribacter sp. KT25b]SDR79700.1 phosphate-selective porin OprO and OprP [Polaribacter sp. KT25b]
MKNKLYILLVAMMLLSIGSFAQNNDEVVTLNQYGQEVEAVELNTEARNSILTFESKDKNYKFWFDNRVYFDGGMFFDKDAYNPIGNGVTIRRARVAMKVIMHKNWYGEIDFDFSGSATEIKDAYIKYTTDAGDLNIKAGHFRESFSMETTTTSRYVNFIERSLMSKFAPSRQLGFQANYIKDTYLLSGGVHFNNQGSFEEVEWSQDANKDYGTDEGYSFTGRAVFRPILDADKVIHIGVAASYRTPKTDLEVPNSYRFSTRSISNVNRKKYLDTDDILNVENNTIYNVELAGAYKNMMFQSEYIGNDISRTNGLSNVNLNGFYAQAGILLSGGKYNYNKNEGEFTQVSLGSKKGELEAAFRFDYIDLNDQNAEIYGGSANAYTLGLNYHFNYNVKFMLDYSYLDHDRYANGKGKLFVGSDINGDLTKDPTKVVDAEGKGGDDYGQLQFRIELDF